MKNVMCLLMSLLMCLSLASATEIVETVDDFAHAIEYKDAPRIVTAVQNDENAEDVSACLLVTSIRAAREMTTDIAQEERDELLTVYEQLLNGTMRLPLEEDYLIWDLVDLSYQLTACRANEEHSHDEWLNQHNTAVTVTFSSGIAKDAEVKVLTYINDAWVVVDQVTNNDDGTITCVFDAICPVAFCLIEGEQEEDASAQTQADDFVPSISYQNGPVIAGAEPGGKDLVDCLVVTSLKQAMDKETDITQEERDELLSVYDKLADGSMNLPLEKEYVIRELVDVSYRKTDCRDAEHLHKEWLAQENTTITIIFGVGIAADEEMAVLTWVNGEWVPAREVINLGDGTVVCILEDLCPVAFCLFPAQ